MKKKKQFPNLLTIDNGSTVEETMAVDDVVNVPRKRIINQLRELTGNGERFFDKVLRNIDRKVDAFWEENTK